jgi:hypothetical protein
VNMTDWQLIATAPKDEVIWLGCESDPAVDRHMFFVDLGWSYKDGFWSATAKDIRFPSHWAKIMSPVPGAAVTFHSRGEYKMNKD